MLCDDRNDIYSMLHDHIIGRKELTLTNVYVTATLPGCFHVLSSLNPHHHTLRGVYQFVVVVGTKILWD